MADAKWQPVGAPRPGTNPGQDPAVQRVVAEIREKNATTKAERRAKR